MKTIENLIEEAKKYIEADKKERKNNSADFNIFKITRIQSDELKICRMLAEIINPEGTHNMQSFFLRLFMKNVLRIETDDDEIESAKIYTEHPTGNGRRIDIAIVTNKRFIPIEVKLYAEDQTRQCKDYYDFADCQGKPEKSKVYYLTLDGHLPQKSGADGLNAIYENGDVIGYEELIPISFREEICSWLKQCQGKDEIKEKPIIKANIEQFMFVLEELSGKMNDIQNERITQIISGSSEDFKAACVIAENVNIAKKNILLKMFQAIERKLIDKDFKLEQLYNKFDYKFNDYDAIKRFFDKRGKTYPAIVFRYKKVDDKREIWFLVEAGWGELYCGFCVAENEDTPGKLVMSHEEIKNYINVPYGFRDSTWWFYYEYLLNDKERLSFFDNNNNEILRLFNEEYFEEYTDKCVERIMQMTQEMRKKDE